MERKKHAYLIMAHNQFEILKKLLLLLDYEWHDIYLHIDKKVKGFNFANFSIVCKKSKVYFVERESIHWGGYSQIKCELELLKSAVKKEYSYFHLLSGVDLPLRTAEELYYFFEKCGRKEFIHFDYINFNSDIQRMSLYHFFQERNLKRNYLLRYIEKLSLFIQKKIGINRIKRNQIIWQKGSNWFSITQDLTKYILNKEKWIKKTFFMTACCDEVFLQTLVFNSKYEKRLYNREYNNNYDSIKRKIDWKRGNPYIWREEDWEQLKDSTFLFARKFDYTIDKNIVEKLYQYIINMKEE